MFFINQKWTPDFKQQKEGFKIPFISSSGSSFNASEYLWGNVVAFNVLNENLRTNKNINICFPACGDLRNFIKSVNSLPKEFKGKIKVELNDYNPKIMIRNFSILYLLLSKGKQAINSVIHLWYSSFLTKHDFINIFDSLKDISKERMKF